MILYSYCCERRYIFRTFKNIEIKNIMEYHENGIFDDNK